MSDRMGSSLPDLRSPPLLPPKSILLLFVILDTATESTHPSDQNLEILLYHPYTSIIVAAATAHAISLWNSKSSGLAREWSARPPARMENKIANGKNGNRE